MAKMAGGFRRPLHQWLPTTVHVPILSTQMMTGEYGNMINRELPMMRPVPFICKVAKC